jgi:hypothetical protein
MDSNSVASSRIFAGNAWLFEYDSLSDELGRCLVGTELVLGRHPFDLEEPLEQPASLRSDLHRAGCESWWFGRGRDRAKRTEAVYRAPDDGIIVASVVRRPAGGQVTEHFQSARSVQQFEGLGESAERYLSHVASCDRGRSVDVVACAVSLNPVRRLNKCRFCTPSRRLRRASCKRECATRLAIDSSGGINVYMTLMHRLRNRHGGSIVRTNARLLGLGTSAAAVCLVLTACGPDSPGPQQSAAPSATASATPSAPTSTSPVDPAESALSAYRSMWKAFVAASDVADPAYPNLARYADGDALKVLVNGVKDLQSKGLVNQGDVLLSPKVTATSVSVKPAQVQIADCVDTAGTHLVKKDGSAYNDSPGGRRSAQIKVTETAAGWKVTSFALFEVGTC